MEDKNRFKSQDRTNKLPEMASQFSYFGNPSQKISLNTNKPNKNTQQYTLNSENQNKMFGVKESVNLMPDVSYGKQQTEPTQITSNNILKGNVPYENLIKTDSINKTNFNINEINQKNKEIMTMEERLKQIPAARQAEKQAQSTVVNNYNGPSAGGNFGSVNRGDPLAGIKNTMRSLPSWRVDMG